MMTEETNHAGKTADSSLPEPAPFVSVVLPIRNEAAFIEENLVRLLQQDYPADRFEIIVADGLSDDGTRQIVEQVASRDARVSVVDNPKRIVPTGMNILIERSQGDIILRLDGHAYVADDFIKQSVIALVQHEEDQVWAVGGPLVHVANTAMGKAVGIAMSHPLGVGNAHHRDPKFEGLGEGTNFPAMYRWVFDKIGMYDETLVRNQDDELYFRLRQAGGKFFITPKIEYVYFVREKLSQLFRQYYQYAFWRIPVMVKHRQPTTLRQLVPSLFYIVMLVLLVIGWLVKSPWIALGLPVIYLSALCIAGLGKVPAAGLGVALRVPAAILTMHAGYAWGMIYGWMCRLAGRNSWVADSGVAKLSR